MCRHTKMKRNPRMVIRIECDIWAYWSGSHWSLNFVVTTGGVANGCVSSSLRILTQLSERTTNCKDSWITVTISSLSWKKKMKAKFQTGPLGNVYSSPLYARAPSLLRLFAESPCYCVSKPAVPTATGQGFICSHTFFGHKHTVIWWSIDHFPSPFSIRLL